MQRSTTVSWTDVELRYPGPVATAAKTYNSCPEDQDPTRKLLCGGTVLETTLSYMCYVLTADHLSRSNGAAEIPGWLENQEVKRGLTLGQWVGMFRSLLKRTDREHAFMPEIRELMRVDAVSAFLDDLTDSRNGFAHRAWPIPWSEAEVREFLASQKPRLSLFLNHLSFLRNYPLCIALEGAIFEGLSDEESEPGEIDEYTIVKCMGSPGSGWPQKSHVSVEPELKTEHPFLLSPDCSRLLYLWPFLADGQSPESGDHEVYILRKLTRPHLVQGKYAATRAREETDRDWRTHAQSFDWLADEVREQYGRVTLPDSDRLKDAVSERMGQYAGTVLGTRRKYRLGKAVGYGSSGTVYEALDERGHRCAVKLLHPHLARTQIRRFVDEIKTLRSLKNHPNILLLHDSGEQTLGGQDRLFYVTEFAERGDLFTYLKDHSAPSGSDDEIPGPERLPTRLFLFTELLKGVAFMHEQGIVHRDLKPSNVMLMGDGTVRIGDLGTIKLMDPTTSQTPKTSEGGVVGTAGYTAPEVLERGSSEANFPVDVYSLGIILFEVLFGRSPATNLGAPEDVLLEQQALSALPNSLRRRVLRCTKKKPQKRYQNARELLEAIGPGIADLLRGEVTLRIEPPDAALSGLSIDGDDVDPEKRTFELDAGEHVLTAHMHGRQMPHEKSFWAVAATERDVHVELPIREAAEAESPAPESLERYLARANVRVGMRHRGYGVSEGIIDENSEKVWRQLVDVYGDGVITDLINRLDTDDRDMQARLVCLITHWGEPEALGEHLEAAHRAIVPACALPVKGRWLQFLLKDPDTTTPQLADILDREPDRRMRLSVVTAVGSLHVQPMQGPLSEALVTEDEGAVRAAIVRALRAGDEQVQRTLTRLLRKDPSEDVRRQCAHELGGTGNLRYIEILGQSARDDNDPLTRTAAASAMLGLDQERARDALREIIDEGDAVIHESLAEAFRQRDDQVMTRYLRGAERKARLRQTLVDGPLEALRRTFRRADDEGESD